MRKVFLIITLFFISKTSFEQVNEKYVEVTIEDTLKIDAEIIDYTVFIQPVNTYSYVDSTSASTTTIDTALIDAKNSNESESFKKRTNEVLTLIKRFKIDTFEYDFSRSKLINDYFGMGRTITMRFKSNEQFNKVIKELRKIDGIQGQILFLHNSKLNQYYPILIHKMLEQAKFNALSIASQCNKKLGDVISLKEENISGGGWTSYPPLSAVGEFVNQNLSDQILLHRKITVRYSWQ